MKKLKAEEDAFGQEMWAFYKGERASQVVERDDGYFDASPNGPRMYFSEFEDWHPVEREAMEFVKGKVLDIGCELGGILCICRRMVLTCLELIVLLLQSKSAS